MAIRLLLFIGIISFTVSSSFAEKHIIKGKVLDSKGEIIPNTAIFIKELRTGTSANLNGDFEISLEKGKYHLVFSSLGFQNITKEISLNRDSEMKVVLQQEEIKIKEVRVYSGGKDPAIPIMKNAISLAPYYRRAIESYQADVYMTGTVKIVKMPAWIARGISVNGEKGIKEGDVLYQESINHVKFRQPDHYEQTVEAVNFVSTSDLGMDDIDPMDYINMSIYEEIPDMYSPLSPRALSYYNFQYLGYYKVGDRIVNKIRVTPKNKNPKCFSGEIAIFDNTWNVHSVQLKNKQYYGTFTIHQTFNDMGKDIYMPTQHKMSMKVGMMGVKVDLDYVASVKYKKVDYNHQLKKPYFLEKYFTAKEQAAKAKEEQKQLSEKVIRQQKKVEELMNKEKLSKRDLVRIAKLSDKIDKAQRESSSEKEKSLEVVSHHNTKVDSLASKKGEAFWNENRPVPLTLEQKKAIIQQDSLTGIADTTKQKKKESSFVANALGALAYVDIYKNEKDSIYLYSSGLTDTFENFFNPVDGWMLWSGMHYSSWKKRISSELKFGYGFSSKRFMFDWMGTKEYNWKRRGQFYWNVRSITSDFKEGNEMSRPLDAISSLLFKDNYKRYYRSDLLRIGNKIDIVNGLTVKATLDYERRKKVENNTNYSFFRKDQDYHLNRPDNADATDLLLSDSNISSYSVEVSYTPEQYYRLDKKRKEKYLLDSRFPTFKIGFKQAIASDFLDTSSKYMHLKGSISQTITSPYDNSFSYFVEGGKIWNASHFSEFKSFRTQQIPIGFNSVGNGFMLPNDYALNEKDWYFHAKANYSSAYLLLKYLPVLNNTLIKETLSVNYLKSSLHNNYVELGYSLDNIFLMGGVGVYTGFEKGFSPRYGVKVYFNL